MKIFLLHAPGKTWESANGSHTDSMVRRDPALTAKVSQKGTGLPSKSVSNSAPQIATTESTQNRKLGPACQSFGWPSINTRFSGSMHCLTTSEFTSEYLDCFFLIEQLRVLFPCSQYSHIAWEQTTGKACSCRQITSSPLRDLRYVVTPSNPDPFREYWLDHIHRPGATLTSILNEVVDVQILHCCEISPLRMVSTYTVQICSVW